jgi:DNA uptake protein ComE-like DNA-binding protein
VSDGLLDRLGLGALAGFAIGVAVASSPGEQRPLRELGRDILAECLRLLEDPRLAAALPVVASAHPLAATLPQAATGPAATPAEQPRRRRRTRAQIEADTAAAAAAAPPPVAEGSLRPRRGGRRPRQEAVPAQQIVAAEVGAGAAPEGPEPPRRGGRRPRQEAAPDNGAQAVEEAAQPTRRGRRPRQAAAGKGAGPQPQAGPPVTAAPQTPPTSAGRRASPDGRVNLNAATRAELMRLPRIGAQAADRIIEFRGQQGRLTGARQLRNADVLSAAQWRQIRDQVRF